MRRIASLCTSLALPLVALAPGRASAVEGASYVHVAGSVPNVIGVDFVSSMDHPLLTGVPGALPLAIHEVPGGLFSVLDPHPVGVAFYSPYYWLLANSDGAHMPLGARFHVFIPQGSAHARVHTSTSENTVSSWTLLDDPLANGEPAARVFVTHLLAPDGMGSVELHPQPLGVWYDERDSAWAIFNEDENAMAVGHDFHVLVVPSDDPDAFVHTATDATIDGPLTVIDHPRTNGRPDVLLLVTQSWNPPGSDGVNNDDAVAVSYDALADRWLVFNTSGAPMPPGASFNVLVTPEPTATAASAVGVAVVGAMARRRSAPRARVS